MAPRTCSCGLCKCKRIPMHPPFDVCDSCADAQHAPEKRETLTAHLANRFGWSLTFAIEVEDSINEYIQAHKRGGRKRA